MASQETDDINAVVDSLLCMFNNILTRDVLLTIAESCGGDLNLSVDAIMKITNESTKENVEDQPITSPTGESFVLKPNSIPSITDTISYAAAFKSTTGTIPKQCFRPKRTIPKYAGNNQVQKIIAEHKNGSRILIIMRGAPGSGKSYLAQKVIDVTIGNKLVNYKTHICSTDDFFQIHGCFYGGALSQAHQWNQNRARSAMIGGLSPIIIDNTNIMAWEMEPYVRAGVENGYIIEVMEPDTPWAKKPNQLVRRNIHGVPLKTIERMLESYECNITGDSIIRQLNLSYPVDKIPPVLRKIPPFEQSLDLKTPSNTNGNQAVFITRPQTSEGVNTPRNTTEKYSPFDVLVKNHYSTDSTVMKYPDEAFNGATYKSDPTSIQGAVMPIPSSSRNTNASLEQCKINNKFDFMENVSPVEMLPQNESLGHTVFENKSSSEIVSENQSLSQTEVLKESLGQTVSENESSIIILPKNDTLGENCPENVSSDEYVSENLNLYITKVQKQLEEIEKVEKEWEDGEDWENDTQENLVKNEIVEPPAPKPPRTNEEQYSEGRMLETSETKNCQDWRQISMFMPPWQDVKPLQIKVDDVPIETKSNSTCIEIGDVNNSHNIFKVISATSRDINQYHISFDKEKIPQKRMLDKSSMTNEVFLTDSTKLCGNVEKHFREFRNLFKNIPENQLRYIFDNCLGDVNWAVEIVLDGVATKQQASIDSLNNSDENENTVSDDNSCNCLAAYNIVPNTAEVAPKISVSQEQNKTAVEIAETKLQFQKKPKKEINMSDSTLVLKRVIEQNVGFSENHYSEHSLKIMKLRRGKHPCLRGLGEENPETSKNNENLISEQLITDTDNESRLQDSACHLNSEEQDSDDDDFGVSSNDVEKTININLGREFISELDSIFGRRDITYPDKVIPKINMPMSLLNYINALWMESFMHQLDEHDKQSAIMLQEDEDFARHLSMKEAELASSGEELEVPDFKEIMDMELALSIYQKDVAEWRNKEPNDWAAKLTRENLCNLFPDVNKELLSELLMAHENNFQATVEVLLVSTGKADILDKKNGLNEFVMNSELERQKKKFEEIKAISEQEWPLLHNDDVVEMSVVQKYRQKADQHLAYRNFTHQKANEYVDRGIISMASHFSGVADFHRSQFERANSLAAISLIQWHAARNPDQTTLDLHYHRVPEARETTALFVDYHIQRLRNLQEQGQGPSYITLFIITGRGLHSNGAPRIKPAMRKLLKSRGLTCVERNPGLLTVRVRPRDKMLYEIQGL